MSRFEKKTKCKLMDVKHRRTSFIRALFIYKPLVHKQQNGDPIQNVPASVSNAASSPI